MKAKPTKLQVPLDATAAKALAFQSYGPAPAIDGVFLQPLTRHRGLNGDFMELLRLSGGKAEGLAAGAMDVRQISIAWAAAGRINAFHVHAKIVQDDLWCVADGRMLVWVVDTRQASPTRGARRSFVLTAEQPALLHIPAGVAHGYKAGPQGALLVYATNSPFNAADPNEGRLPWDFFGAQLWEDDRG